MRALLPLVLSLTLAAQSAKRPLTHKDYDSWRTISSPQLSRDGKWLAYGLMPQDGDGELVIRNLTTNQESRHPAGALPPPPIVTAAEANPEAEPPRVNLTIRFTSDSQFVVANYFPTKAEAAKAGAKGGVTVVQLADSRATRIANIRDFQVPAKGGPWLAMHQETATPPPPEVKGAEDNEHDSAAAARGADQPPAPSAQT